jgi:hypothetical protein
MASAVELAEMPAVAAAFVLVTEVALVDLIERVAAA